MACVHHYQKWWTHESSYERYNYSYSDEELQEWAPKIEKMAGESEKLFAFANNHYQGQSVSTAQQLSRLLQQAGLPLPS